MHCVEGILGVRLDTDPLRMPVQGCLYRVDTQVRSSFNRHPDLDRSQSILLIILLPPTKPSPKGLRTLSTDDLRHKLPKNLTTRNGPHVVTEIVLVFFRGLLSILCPCIDWDTSTVEGNPNFFKGECGKNIGGGWWCLFGL